MKMGFTNLDNWQGKRVKIETLYPYDTQKRVEGIKHALDSMGLPYLEKVYHIEVKLPLGEIPIHDSETQASVEYCLEELMLPHEKVDNRIVVWEEFREIQKPDPVEYGIFRLSDCGFCIHLERKGALPRNAVFPRKDRIVEYSEEHFILRTGQPNVYRKYSLAENKEELE